jgi:hypothetical protein
MLGHGNRISEEEMLDSYKTAYCITIFGIQADCYLVLCKQSRTGTFNIIVYAKLCTSVAISN